MCSSQNRTLRSASPCAAHPMTPSCSCTSTALTGHHVRIADCLQDVVYAFKPDQDTAVSISLCGSSYDTVLDLYQRSSDWAAIEPVSCNDDFCGPQSYLQV